MQELTLQPQGMNGGSVESVARDGVPEGCKVDPNLMSPAGFGPGLNEGVAGIVGDCAIVSHRLAPTGHHGALEWMGWVAVERQADDGFGW